MRENVSIIEELSGGKLRYCLILFKRKSNELHFFKVASIWDVQVSELFIWTPNSFSDSDIWICSPLIARYGGSSIIFFAVYLEARNIALDFEVFFFMSLLSHQSEKLSRSAFKKAVTVLR